MNIPLQFLVLKLFEVENKHFWIHVDRIGKLLKNRLSSLKPTLMGVGGRAGHPRLFHTRRNALAITPSPHTGRNEQHFSEYTLFPLPHPKGAYPVILPGQLPKGS